MWHAVAYPDTELRRCCKSCGGSGHLDFEDVASPRSGGGSGGGSVNLDMMWYNLFVKHNYLLYHLSRLFSMLARKSGILFFFKQLLVPCQGTPTPLCYDSSSKHCVLRIWLIAFLLLIDCGPSLHLPDPFPQ